MLKDFAITCSKCGKKVVSFDRCMQEYHIDIDGWDGGIDFLDHKEEYCKGEGTNDSLMASRPQ